MPAANAIPRPWTHPLEHGIPPKWASQWGEDSQFGPWCAIEIGKAVQRLRWIPPGNFWMGSTKEEVWRWPDEGPRHRVEIEQGFWMFDTPCTQALWEEVMPKNPSAFKDKPDYPVESVTWNDCQEFVKSMNARLDGLELSLPSEAQWEYACRAGTDTARYSEDLGAIAWYDDNSEGKTHPVGLKEANKWGLYDMLGNVWDWCIDEWASDYSEKAVKSASAHRVIRGGSWDRGARVVRAACRVNDKPSNRFNVLGFRCAEFRPGITLP